MFSNLKIKSKKPPQSTIELHLEKNWNTNSENNLTKCFSCSRCLYYHHLHLNFIIFTNINQSHTPHLKILACIFIMRVYYLNNLRDFGIYLDLKIFKITYISTVWPSNYKLYSHCLPQILKKIEPRSSCKYLEHCKADRALDLEDPWANDGAWCLLSRKYMWKSHKYMLQNWYESNVNFHFNKISSINFHFSFITALRPSMITEK